MRVGTVVYRRGRVVDRHAGGSVERGEQERGLVEREGTGGQRVAMVGGEGERGDIRRVDRMAGREDKKDRREIGKIEGG